MHPEPIAKRATCIMKMNYETNKQNIMYKGQIMVGKIIRL